MITNLAFCGGGFYGYAEVGALTIIEQYPEYLAIQNIKGVSVGSIIASLYAVGYNALELTKILFEMDFDLLIKDNRVPYINFYERYGMYDANKLEEEIERFIQEKTHIKNCTFSQIEKNLTVFTTNLNYQRSYQFNKESTPDMVISKAVRMSISYPPVICPVVYNGELYGDGGESLNYPIITFDDLDATIGITCTSHNENEDGSLNKKCAINDVYDYIRAIASTMNRSTYISQITSKYLDRSIVVHIDNNISSMQFNLTEAQKKELFECGIKCSEKRILQLLKNDNNNCL